MCFGVRAIIRTCTSLGQALSSQCFPFYTYAEDGSNRRENITDWALEQFQTHYRDKKISKWDIFHYVYAVLHHPQYRERYAANLSRELPRIPFAPDFHAFADGRQASSPSCTSTTSSSRSIRWHRIENRQAAAVLARGEDEALQGQDARSSTTTSSRSPASRPRPSNTASATAPRWNG